MKTFVAMVVIASVVEDMKTFVAMVVIASVGEDICGHGGNCECW